MPANFRSDTASGRLLGGHDIAMEAMLVIQGSTSVTEHLDAKANEMALNRVRLPCPACGKPIVLSLRKAAQYDFQVGCIECKTISQSAELVNAMKANEAAARDAAEDLARSAGNERAE
jgi:hypothetical protein